MQAGLATCAGELVMCGCKVGLQTHCLWPVEGAYLVGHRPTVRVAPIRRR